MSTCWRPLKLTSANSHVPPLLISCTFTQSSYSVYVTDLTHIWSESLDKRAIERRSEDEETSINPVNDPEQLKILLNKLDGGLNGAPKSSLSLSSRKGRSRSEPSSLALSIIATLPKPLEPLKWPLRLEVTSQSALTTHLTVPLIRAQNSRAKEVEDLVEMLRDKDHVIQKLVDKLDATGADLTQIFAGAVGKNGRALPRPRAEERIKGLKPFDAEAWRNNARDNDKEMEMKSVGDVLGELFVPDSRFALDSKAGSEISAEWDDWWENLEEISLDASRLSHMNTASGPVLDVDTPEASDDFQVQATPPALNEVPKENIKVEQSPTKHRKHSVVDDSTEDDEPDLDAPFPRPNVVPDSLPFSQPASQQKRIGKIGGPGAKGRSRSPVNSKTPEKPAKTFRDDDLSGDETATEDDEPSRAVSPRKHTPSPQPTKPKRATLGKIGGKKSEPTTATISDKGKKSISVPETILAPKHGAGGDDTKVGHEIRSRIAIEKNETPAPEETEQEKADRKRAEKKREIEEKAKVPAKKKRKF